MFKNMFKKINKEKIEKDDIQEKTIDYINNIIEEKKDDFDIKHEYISSVKDPSILNEESNDYKDANKELLENNNIFMSNNGKNESDNINKRNNKNSSSLENDIDNKIKKFDLNIENVLENWEVYHGLREIIANAMDEQKLRVREK